MRKVKYNTRTHIRTDICQVCRSCSSGHCDNATGVVENLLSRMPFLRRKFGVGLLFSAFEGRVSRRLVRWLRCFDSTVGRREGRREGGKEGGKEGGRVG